MTTTVSEKIKGVAHELVETSFHAKQDSRSHEDRVNEFLDAILELKKHLTSQTNEVNSITEKIEELTWCTDKLTEEDLKNLNMLISSAKDLRTTLIKHFIWLNNNPARKGIAKDEICLYKDAIDDFTCAYKDIEHIYFYLPNDKDFNSITESLMKL